jgi:hypothetical protein
MDSKKLAAIGVLVVVIVVAVVITMKRTGNEAPPAGAFGTETASKKMDKIDMKTLEVFSELPSDWSGKYAPDASGRYKNPKTGEYTVVDAMRCASCGQLIPVPEIPADQLPPPPAKGPARSLADIGARQKYGAAKGLAMLKARQSYICPRCGKPAFGVAGTAGAEGTTP